MQIFVFENHTNHLSCTLSICENKDLPECAVRILNLNFSLFTISWIQEKIAMLQENESLRKEIERLNKEKDGLLKSKESFEEQISAFNKSRESLQKDLKDREKQVVIFYRLDILKNRALSYVKCKYLK